MSPRSRTRSGLEIDMGARSLVNQPFMNEMSFPLRFQGESSEDVIESIMTLVDPPPVTRVVKTASFEAPRRKQANRRDCRLSRAMWDGVQRAGWQRGCRSLGI